MAQGQFESLLERIDALAIERQEHVRLALAHALLHPRRRLVDHRIDRTVERMTGNEGIAVALAPKLIAVAVAECRPEIQQAFGHRGKGRRNAESAGPFHAGEYRARFRRKKKPIAGEPIGAERIAHEAAAARRDHDRAGAHGPWLLHETIDACRARHDAFA
jgi:hypothetical protein